MKKSVITKDYIIERCFKVMNRNINGLNNLASEYKDDIEIMLPLIRKDVFAYRYASVNIRAKKDLALMVLKKEGILFDSVDESLRSDVDVVKMAVSSYGLSLALVDKELRDDEEIVRIAIKNNPRALSYASKRLRKKLDLILFAYSISGPFIVEPQAYQMYVRVCNSIPWKNLSEDMIEKEPLYFYCIKFNKGIINPIEMIDFERMLMKKVNASKSVESIENQI